MGKRPLDPNAIRALNEMKLEIANELGMEEGMSNLDSVSNIFNAGAIGGRMTRNLVEMGQKQLIQDNKEME